MEFSNRKIVGMIRPCNPVDPAARKGRLASEAPARPPPSGSLRKPAKQPARKKCVCTIAVQHRASDRGPPRISVTFLQHRATFDGAARRWRGIVIDLAKQLNDSANRKRRMDDCTGHWVARAIGDQGTAFANRSEVGTTTMKIRNLLLGSAAALVSVNAAYAADAIVIAEPEPVEYVRVCDAYGAGFFYIPGTETCLKFSGFVWYQVAAESFTNGGDSPDYQTYGANPVADGWISGVRARLEVDARSDTEWGTLRGMMRIQADTGGVNADAQYVMDNAYVQLGGLRVGYTETVFNDSIGAGVASYGSHSWGSMSYGFRKVQQISYSVGSDQGFAATISLEDDANTGDGYVPDIAGAVSYNQGWGAVWAKAGYDESMDGFGATIGMHYNIPQFEGSSFRLIGYYADSDNAYGVASPSGTSEFSVLTSYYHQFTPTFGASVGFQYFNDYYVAGTSVGTGVDGYAAELNLVWTPLENFEVRSEIYYDKVENLNATGSGFLRFTRFF
jgi:hypothetical protein